MDEQNLIGQLRSGSHQALEEAVHLYTHYVTAVAARVLLPAPSQEDLEEVVSDTFLALWRFREQLDSGRSLRSWLAVAARNLATDRLRQRKETEDIPPDLTDRRPGPEELAEQLALHRRLRQLVEDWDESTKTATAAYRGVTVTASLGSSTLYVDGQPVEMVWQDWSTWETGQEDPPILPNPASISSHPGDLLVNFLPLSQSWNLNYWWDRDYDDQSTLHSHGWIIAP